jgi:hypothetical protein
MHEHCECKHELKHCPVCDVVYCTKCGKEWGKTVYINNYPVTYNPPTTYEPYFPWQITYSGTHTCNV